MATLPDTLDIADNLASFASVPLNQLQSLIESSVTRLRQLHDLGSIEEQNLADARAQLTALSETYSDVVESLTEVSTSLATVTQQRDTAKTEIVTLKARIRELETPPTETGIPVSDFRKRLLTLRLKLLQASDSLKAKWSIILSELDYYTVIYNKQDPVKSLIDMAVTDGLATESEAEMLRS
jgi:chromosome segregation ATPase